jgi:predicted nucleic acid-binding protein
MQRSIAILVQPATVPRIVPNDPDDDRVIACAIAARAELIVSGDSDLLAVKEYQGIRIVNAAEAARAIVAP